MAKSLDYFLALSSPYTYMGHGRFEELAARRGLAVNYKPANMGEVFAVSGGLPVKQRAPQRQAYRFMELKRWRTFLDVPLNLEPKHFPVPDAGAARMVIAASEAGQAPAALIGGFLRAVWAEERNIADPETLSAIAAETGYDANLLVEKAALPETENTYKTYTAEAIERGVFGVPTWHFDGELFWGQDRLDFLERALARSGT